VRNYEKCSRTRSEDAAAASHTGTVCSWVPWTSGGCGNPVGMGSSFAGNRTVIRAGNPSSRTDGTDSLSLTLRQTGGLELRVSRTANKKYRRPGSHAHFALARTGRVTNGRIGPVQQPGRFGASPTLCADPRRRQRNQRVRDDAARLSYISGTRFHWDLEFACRTSPGFHVNSIGHRHGGGYATRGGSTRKVRSIRIASGSGAGPVPGSLVTSCRCPSAEASTRCFIEGAGPDAASPRFPRGFEPPTTTQVIRAQRKGVFL